MKTNIPSLGERPPKRGNRFSRAMGRLMLRLLGYHFTGTIPDREKFVVIIAPHTSAMDFVVAMFAIAGLGLRVSWMGAEWIFRYPFIRWMGGIRIERSKSTGVVAQTIEQFENHQRLVIALSPEGTRKKSVPWKTGFFRIAEGSKVPILMAGLCHQSKEIRLGPAVEPDIGLDAFMDEARSFYSEYLERYPDRFGI